MEHQAKERISRAEHARQRERVALNASLRSMRTKGKRFEKLDEKNVPRNDRYVFVTPAAYYGIVQNDKIVNRDFGGTNGVYSDGTVINVAGMQVVMTNNLALNHPTVTTDTAANKYGINASSFLGVVMQKQALGTVELLSMASESEYDIRRQGTLMVSKMAVGHATLRPECMVAIKNATS